MELKQDEATIFKYIRKWFEIVNKHESFDDQIMGLLEFLGEEYNAERTYIFELNKNDNYDNTYEWCKNEVESNLDIFKNEDLHDLIREFHKCDYFLVENLEQIRNKIPYLYALLKPRGINKVLLFPIFLSDRVIGFFGFDNFDFNFSVNILNLLVLSAKRLSQLISTKNITRNLKYCIYHDPLTSSLNRNSLISKLIELKSKKMTSLAIACIDILGIVELNRKYEENMASEHILRCHKILSEVFYEYPLYQICDEKFVFVFENIRSQKYKNLISKLSYIINEEKLSICLGTTYSDDSDLNPSKLLYKAMLEMNINKADYYASHKKKAEANLDYFLGENKNSILDFVYQNELDLDLFYNSISMNNENYPYLANIEKDLWYISDAMKETWGFSSNVVEGMLPKWEAFIVNSDDKKLFRDKIHENLNLLDKNHDLVYKVRDKNNEEFWIRCFGRIGLNKDKTKVVSFCGSINRLNYTMVVDPVTNFMKEQAAISKTVSLVQNDEVFSHICFKYNGFADINQLIGKDRANELLKEIASLMVSEFNGYGDFFRFDGLRFLYISQVSDEKIVQDSAKRIQIIAEELYSRYNIFVSTPCSVSIISSDYNSSANELIENIYNVFSLMKGNSKSDIIFSSDYIKEDREKRRMLMSLNNNASNGLENFRVVVQPIVSAKTKEIVSGEILLRWRYKGKDVSPFYFIPELEKTGLILPVGRWVALQSARICKRAKAYKKDFFMDFNTSYEQINDEGLTSYIQSLLSSYKLEGQDLVLELTENHVDDTPIKLTQLIDGIKDLNLRVALDDFGVGYSSLEMLFKYPADIIKLDKSIMKKMSDEEKNTKFIASIISACHNIDKKVCVEGVETEAQLQNVLKAGVDFIQGYYFYRPMEVNDFFSELSKNK